jgi:hypothetical protein
MVLFGFVNFCLLTNEKNAKNNEPFIALCLYDSFMKLSFWEGNQAVNGDLEEIGQNLN